MVQIIPLVKLFGVYSAFETLYIPHGSDNTYAIVQISKELDEKLYIPHGSDNTSIIT